MELRRPYQSHMAHLERKNPMFSRKQINHIQVLCFFLSIFLLISSKPIPAQDLLAEMKIDGIFGLLGVEVGVLGDVDGDSYYGEH